MSQAASIILTGKSTKKLIEELEAIIAWDDGQNYDICVYAIENGPYIMDSIDNVKEAINTNIADYIEKKLPQKNKVLKYGGNNDIYYVEDPDKVNYDGQVTKQRNRITNFTPKKKKRRKVKR